MQEYDIDSAWENFLENSNADTVPIKNQDHLNHTNSDKLGSTTPNIIPKGSDLYISTKTKIAYLSHPIDLFKVFWEIMIVPYSKPEEGVIKKQMKFNFLNEESVQEVHES